ncbi:HEAT repeat-containing protein 6 [Orchesella cincta]|uniref:HEAT repeat-containing protein 6 n=1 Tax=Orchesella cincta TaxID=48709 RepID=A0A1D2NAU5_ORCCI|nr:HEAT repeat-containing protein 6 [Orchesella cincta]
MARREGDKWHTKDTPGPRPYRNLTQTDSTRNNEVPSLSEDIDDDKMTQTRFNEIIRFIEKPYGADYVNLIAHYERLWHCWHDLYVVFDPDCRLNMGRAKWAIQLANNCFPSYLALMERRLTYAHYIKCPTDCMIEAMKCCVLIFTKISKYLDPDYLEHGLDQEFLQKFDVHFQNLVGTLIDNILKCSSVLGSAMIDVLAAIGSHLYLRLPEEVEKRIVPFLMSVTNADPKHVSSQVKARVGRCFGKYIEFPWFRADFPFMVGIFELCERFLLQSENVMKISYAWVFANWTDVIVNDFPSTDENLYNNDINIRILSTLILYTNLPVKAKYNIGRAAGNIFAWMDMQLLEIEVVRNAIRKLTENLVAMIGTGQDYKLRWNCAYALGNILGNRIFFHYLEADVVDPIIKTLSKWMVNSQNFKERAQCVTSLRKVVDKDIYGDRYALVWNRLCLSLAVLPVETCEGIQKFKSECILLFFHLTNMLETKDFPSINDAVTGNMQHLRSLVDDFAGAILMEDFDAVITANEYIKDIENQLAQLPYETTASALADIVQLAVYRHRGTRRDSASST